MTDSSPISSDTHRSESPPKKSRRGCLGCGMFVLICAVALFVWTRDVPPVDDSDLLPPPFTTVEAAGPTVLEGLVELAARSAGEAPIIEEIEFAGGTPAHRPRPLSSPWRDPEVRAALASFIEDEGVSLEELEAVLACEVYGGVPVESFSEAVVGPIEARHFATFLEHRLLLARIDGEGAVASQLAARQLHLADRTLTESGFTLLHGLVSVSIASMAWQNLTALALEGDIDPVVEAEILARENAGPAFRRGAGMLLRHEYQYSGSTIEELPELATEGEVGIPPIATRLVFKPNATRARLAEHYRTWIAAVEAPFPVRELPAPFEPTKPLTMILHSNVGLLLVDMIVPQLERLVSAIDRAILQEHAARTVIALARYRRDHGELPPDLETLVGAVPGLTVLPLDPYTGEPLRYDRARGILWSEGEDGVDDGGTTLESWDDVEDPFDLADPTWKL